MKKLFSALVIVLAMSFLTIPLTQAAEIKMADSLLIPEKIFDDAYILAGNGTIDGDVTGDLYIAGGIVTINGNVGQDLVVAGGRVTVLGMVYGDIRLLGGQLSIYGKVGEDVVAVGGQVDIGKNSFVNGSVLSSSGILTVDGQIKGDLRGVLGMLILNGAVGGNVTINAQDKINVASTAKVMGNFEYSSLFETKIPEGVVQGKVTFNQFEKNSLLEKFTYWFFIEKLYSFVAAGLLTFILVMFAPKVLITAGENTRKDVLKSFGVGLLSVIGTVVGSMLLVVTIIGVPLALMALAMLLIVFYVAQIFVAAWLGGYMFNYKKHDSKLKLFGILMLTLLIYKIIGVIPYVGWAVNLVLFLTGVGSFVMMKIEYAKFLHSKKMF